MLVSHQGRVLRPTLASGWLLQSTGAASTPAGRLSGQSRPVRAAFNPGTRR